MKTVRIGTRESRLAVIQAKLVAEAIWRYDPAIPVQIVPMKTTGDRILNRTLDQIGGKGLFVKELDQALLEESVDIAVHSCKDLPMELDHRLPVVAASRREDPRDVLVLPAGKDALDFTRPVGCSSSRRRIQLQRLDPRVRVEPVRGNVLTRLEKLDSGEYAALVLAAAGLNRLALGERISRVFSAEEMLPAAGQGILAVQARRGEDVRYLSLFHSRESMQCANAERAFVRALDGGCSTPCAAYGRMEGGVLRLKGMYVSGDECTVRYGEIQCAPHRGEELAEKMAKEMKHEADRQGGDGGSGTGGPRAADAEGQAAAGNCRCGGI